MKILLFSQYFWPENFRINDIAIFLKNKKYDLTVLTGRPSYPKKELYNKFYLNRSSFNKYKKIDVIRVPIIARKESNFLIFLNYISFFFSSIFFGISKLIKKNFDIIFVFTPSPILNAIPAIIIKKIFKIKLVIWVLDLWPNTLVDLNLIKNKYLIHIFKNLVRFIYNNADIILVQSQSFRREINKISNTKCLYMPAWPEDNIKNRKDIFAKEIKKKEKRLKIIFTGNIGQAQDFDSLIKCAKILKHKKIVKWIIVGDGRWKNNLLQLIKSNNLQNDFQLIGNVPINRIGSFFNHADALFLSLKDEPTFKKTIPGKLQTYLSTGKPIIAMISGEAQKIIKIAKCGFVCDAGDFSSLAKNIIIFNNTKNKRRKIFGINAKNYLKENFNKIKILNNLNNILRKEVNNKKN